VLTGDVALDNRVLVSGHIDGLKKVLVMVLLQHGLSIGLDLDLQTKVLQTKKVLGPWVLVLTHGIVLGVALETNILYFSCL